MTLLELIACLSAYIGAAILGLFVLFPEGHHNVFLARICRFAARFISSIGVFVICILSGVFYLVALAPVLLVLSVAAKAMAFIGRLRPLSKRGAQ